MPERTSVNAVGGLGNGQSGNVARTRPEWSGATRLSDSLRAHLRVCHGHFGRGVSCGAAMNDMSVRLPISCAALAAALSWASPATAQEPPLPIPLLVVDVHAHVLSFPQDPLLAESRNLNPSELPGLGLGGDLGAHIYPLKWRAMTLGFGGQMTASRARRSPEAGSTLRSTTGRFTSIAPQLSFNFGTGTGWSYLSGGIARSRWSIVPDEVARRTADDEWIKTINYGGGARWFAKPRLAFSFDVRFYAINPGTAGLLPGSPRTTLMIIGAGVSLK